ncbi:MAG: C4-dicarboxylate TRAP transporter substrate-binding protein [Anaerovoracaceae bacterium]|jgi:tripartite ATP-independent transporter DctP family solute receptor
MKKKRLLSLLLVLALIMAFLPACGTDGNGGNEGEGDAVEPVIVRVGYENNPGEPIDIACKAWAEYLDELSGGTMVMQLYPSSQLGSKNDIIDQMLAGSNVVTLADGAFTADRGAPEMGIQFAPFLFDSYDEAWKLVESDWWQEQVDICAENGLQILTSNFVYGTRNLMTTKPVHSVQDLKGMKIRIPNNTIQIKGFEALGATPTPMPLGDVYTALQQGTIDGVENPAAALLGLGFAEVAKYLIIDQHVFNTTLWLCGTDWFNTLTEEQQGWLMESGRMAGLVSQELDAELEAEALQKLQEAGVEIYYPTEEELQGFKDAALKFYDYPEIKELFSEGLYDQIISIIKE